MARTDGIASIIRARTARRQSDDGDRLHPEGTVQHFRKLRIITECQAPGQVYVSSPTDMTAASSRMSTASEISSGVLPTLGGKCWR